MKTICRDNSELLLIERVNDLFTNGQRLMSEQDAFEILHAYLVVKHRMTSGVLFKDDIVICIRQGWTTL